MRKTALGLAILSVILAMVSVAVAQDRATAQEVISKVKDAASALAKSGDLNQFKQEQGPWVWKDTYVFVLDCDKKVAAVNPKFPQHAGRPMTDIKDSNGKPLYGDPAAFCEVARKPSGTWLEYMWTRPGEKEPSRKVSYFLSAKGTPYVVGSGVYDDKVSIDNLKTMSGK